LAEAEAASPLAKIYMQMILVESVGASAQHSRKMRTGAFANLSQHRAPFGSGLHEFDHSSASDDQPAYVKGIAHGVFADAGALLLIAAPALVAAHTGQATQPCAMAFDNLCQVTTHPVCDPNRHRASDDHARFQRNHCAIIRYDARQTDRLVDSANARERVRLRDSEDSPARLKLSMTFTLSPRRRRTLVPIRFPSGR
jgi:hypothetical protein